MIYWKKKKSGKLWRQRRLNANMKSVINAMIENSVKVWGIKEREIQKIEEGV